MARHVPLLVLALAAALSATPGAAQERQDDAPVTTNRGANAPAPPPEVRAPKPPPALAPDPFAWLRDAKAPAALQWRAQEQRQQERWLAVDPNYAALLETARRSAPRDDAVMLAAGRLFARRAEDAGWRSRPLDAGAAHADWRAEPALAGEGAPRLDCGPRRARGCLLVRRTAAGLTLSGYDPATGQTSPSPFAPLADAESATLDGSGGLMTVSREAGVAVVRRLAPRSAAAEAPLLFRAAAGETVEPGVALGAQGQPVAWLTVRNAGGEAALWIETEGAFRRLAAPRGAAVVGVVGDQLVLLLREGWSAAADLPAGSLIALDLPALLKRAPELTPHRILSLVDAPDVRAARATAAGLLLVVHEGRADELYLCQPGMRGWAVRRLPEASAETWGVLAADAASDEVVLRARAFPDGDHVAEVSTRTGLLSRPLPDRPVFVAAESATHEATALDQSHVAYTVLRGDPAARSAALPILLLPAPRDGGEAEALQALGRLWLGRGGDVAVAGRRARRYDADNTYVDVLVSFEDLSSIGKDLVTRGLAPGGRVALAGFRTGASIAALDVVKHSSQWSAAVLVDPVADPLRATGESDDGWTALFASARRPEARALWRRVAAYDGLRAGPRYAPTLVIATPQGAPDYASDGPRFTARLNESGGDGLYVGADDSAQAAALAAAFLLRLGR